MSTIKIKDKEFAVSIPEEKILKEVERIAAQISKDLEGKNPLFLAVLNGSFVFAADLFRRITIPAEISFVKLASYEGTSSTGVIKEVMGLSENIAGRTVVVVEDIIDTGCTMAKLVENLGTPCPPPLFGYIDLRGIEVRNLTILYETSVIISDFQQKTSVQPCFS